jgi:hypothetical protein
MHASKDSIWRVEEEIFWVGMWSEHSLIHILNTETQQKKCCLNSELWRQHEKKTMDAIHRKSELGDTAASWHMHNMVSMLLVNRARE